MKGVCLGVLIELANQSNETLGYIVLKFSRIGGVAQVTVPA
jgi:hypothetical protein